LFRCHPCDISPCRRPTRQGSPAQRGRRRGRRGWMDAPATEAIVPRLRSAACLQEQKAQHGVRVRACPGPTATVQHA
jgi:hypothetical protein